MGVVCHSFFHALLYLNDPKKFPLQIILRNVIDSEVMNAEMWSKPSVRRNVQQVRQDGIRVVEPASGWLSCGMYSKQIQRARLNEGPGWPRLGQAR